jgi:hypothetical protein
MGMINQTSTIEELVAALGEAVAEITSLMESLTDEQINKVPYEDSWTAGQLLRHVSKSMAHMPETMNADGQKADREITQRVPELKSIFLDFSNKFQSPDFIKPEPGPYSKQDSIDELNEVFRNMKMSVEGVDLETVIEGLPMGPVTKLELVHFLVYHTQRHLHQMNKITNALNN